MAIKKIYYYKIGILDKISNDKLDNNYKDLFDMVFGQYRLDDGKYNPIILNQGEMVAGQRIDRITMDIISNDINYLFARVSRSKDNKESLIRNINTNEIEEVLNPDELTYKTLEAYTYFILDYTKGILAFVEGLQAPNVYCLANIIKNHYDSHEMIIENIASRETVRALLQPGSVVSKINYDFRVPNPAILKGIGLSERTIDILTDADVTMAKLTIKNDPRKNITADNNIISILIKELRNSNRDDNKVTVVGKTKSSSLQEYGFEVKNYMTPIDIPTSRILDGQVIQLNLNEIADEYFTRMRSAYIGSIGVIQNLANL